MLNSSKPLDILSSLSLKIVLQKERKKYHYKNFISTILRNEIKTKKSSLQTGKNYQFPHYTNVQRSLLIYSFDVDAD